VSLLSCAQCGADVETGKRFCGECGTPVVIVETVAAAPTSIELRCQTCGTLALEGHRFCGECGGPIVEVPVGGAGISGSNCATCGAALAEGAVFCEDCGAPAAASPDQGQSVADGSSRDDVAFESATATVIRPAHAATRDTPDAPDMPEASDIPETPVTPVAPDAPVGSSREPEAAVAAVLLTPSITGAAESTPSRGWMQHKWLIIAGAVGLVVLALVVGVLAGRGGSGALLVVSSYDGTVSAVSADGEGQPEETGLYGVSRGLSWIDQETGDYDYGWVAPVGDRLYAVTQLGDDAYLMSSAVGDDESVELYRGDPGTFSPLVLADGRIVVYEYGDGDSTCVLIDGENQDVVARGDTCGAAIDGRLFYEAKSSPSGLDVTVYTDEGEEVASFELRGASLDSFRSSPDLSAFAYTVPSGDESRSTGFYVGADGSPIGETDPMQYLSIEDQGEGFVFQGDSDGVARFWVGSGDGFALVGEGESGRVALAPSGEAAVLTYADSRATIEKVTLQGERSELVPAFPSDELPLAGVTNNGYMVASSAGARPQIVVINLADFSTNSVTPRSVSGNLNYLAITPEGYVAQYDDDGSQTTWLVDTEEGDTRELVEGPMNPIGLAGDRLIYSQSDEVNIMSLTEEGRPRRLLGDALVDGTQAFVDGDVLFATVRQDDVDSELDLPIGDVVSASLDSSRREAVIAQSSILVSLPGADGLTDLGGAFIGSTYDPQSIGTDEAVDLALVQAGCQATEEIGPSVGGLVTTMGTCYLSRTTAPLTVTVGSSDGSQDGYVEVYAILPSGEAVYLDGLASTSDCARDIYGSCDYGQPAVFTEGVQQFTAPDGSIAYALRSGNTSTRLTVTSG
jgi:hypothetical protein